MSPHEGHNTDKIQPSSCVAFWEKEESGKNAVKPNQNAAATPAATTSTVPFIFSFFKHPRLLFILLSVSLPVSLLKTQELSVYK